MELSHYETVIAGGRPCGHADPPTPFQGHWFLEKYGFLVVLLSFWDWHPAGPGVYWLIQQKYQPTNYRRYQ